MHATESFTGHGDEVQSLLAICNAADGLDIPIYLEAEEPIGRRTRFTHWSNGALVGFAHLPDDPEPEACLMVHPDHRRQGIGRALLAALRTEAGHRGLTRFLLVTDAASTAAAAFLRAAGAQLDFSEHRMMLDRTRTARPAPLPGFRLRPAEPDELDTIIRIRAAAFGEDPEETRASVLHRLAEPGRRYLLGELDGTPLGLLRTGPWEGGADITSFGVLPERRGKGYGRRMLLGAIDLLIAEGAESITIEVATENEHALTLYRSCGFDQRVRFDYYVAPVDS